MLFRYFVISIFRYFSKTFTYIRPEFCSQLLRQQVADSEAQEARVSVQFTLKKAYGSGGIDEFLQTTHAVVPERLPDIAVVDVTSIPGLASLRNGAMASLFALGQDAWNLLPWLELMRKDPDFAFPGASGTYSMGRGGIDRGGIDRDGGGLRREPAWAVFSGGLPVPLADPAEPGPAPPVNAEHAPTR